MGGWRRGRKQPDPGGLVEATQWRPFWKDGRRMRGGGEDECSLGLRRSKWKCQVHRGIYGSEA